METVIIPMRHAEITNGDGNRIGLYQFAGPAPVNGIPPLAFILRKIEHQRIRPSPIREGRNHMRMLVPPWRAK